MSRLYVSYKSSSKKLLKYQLIVSCVIIFLILITNLFYRALISQAEFWYWSLLGLEGLKKISNLAPRVLSYPSLQSKREREALVGSRPRTPITKIYDLEFYPSVFILKGKSLYVKFDLKVSMFDWQQLLVIVLNQYAAKPEPLAVLAVQRDKT